MRTYEVYTHDNNGNDKIITVKAESKDIVKRLIVNGYIDCYGTTTIYYVRKEHK